MAEWRKPRCKKCGNQHLNFEKCDEARIDNPPVIMRAPRQDGLTDWANKSWSGTVAPGRVPRIDVARPPIGQGRVVHGGEVLDLPKLPKPKPELTYPNTPPEAA